MNAEDACQMVTNPDISGIGVRVSLYVQTILGMFISTVLPYDVDAFKSSARSTYITAFGLMLAALIRSHESEGLSLADGIILTMLTTLMTAFVSSNTRSVQAGGLSLSIASFICIVVWFVSGILVWRDPSNFGATSDCNLNSEFVFVVFGHNHRATEGGVRAFALVVFSLGGAAALGSLVMVIFWTLKTMLSDDSPYEKSSSDQIPVQGWAGLGAVIYLIVTTELIIRRNNLGGQTWVWSTGQMLSVILLFQQVVDMFKVFTKAWRDANHRSTPEFRWVFSSAVLQSKKSTSAAA